MEIWQLTRGHKNLTLSDTVAITGSKGGDEYDLEKVLIIDGIFKKLDANKKQT